MRRKLLAIKVGERFGRWVVKEPPYRTQNRSAVRVVCECDCGVIRDVDIGNILAGHSTSCGCLNKEVVIARSTTHGHSRRGKKRERLYTTWASMIARCSNPKQIGFKDYGGRGIRVCVAWRKYVTFMKWAKENGYRDDLTIERLNSNGNYCPSNCIWIPGRKQNRNRRDTRLITAFGETKGIADWADDKRCTTKSVGNIARRLGLGWSPEEAISSPKQTKWSRRGQNARPNRPST